MIQAEQEPYISTREKILRYLLLHRSSSEECCSIKQIAAELGLSTNAARQYMVVLEKDGLVVRTERKGATGRPAMTYTLTDNAFEFFPKVYRDLAIYLVDIIKSRHGVAETVTILEMVGKRIATEIKEIIESRMDRTESFDSLPVKQRLEKVAEVFHEYGKFPELLEDETSFSLLNYNCLVYGVVRHDPLVCKVDEIMIAELAGQKCTKEKCLRDGDACCLYRIQKLKAS
ncbi:MAG: helix-turn-helix transcriptional regulator [Candidatus Hodarchaeota archaeon]